MRVRAHACSTEQSSERMDEWVVNWNLVSQRVELVCYCVYCLCHVCLTYILGSDPELILRKLNLQTDWWLTMIFFLWDWKVNLWCDLINNTGLMVTIQQKWIWFDSMWETPKMASRYTSMYPPKKKASSSLLVCIHILLALIFHGFDHKSYKSKRINWYEQHIFSSAQSICWIRRQSAACHSKV